MNAADAKTGKLLGRGEILAAEDIDYLTIAVPEWGGDVRIKSLDGEERDELESTTLSMNGSDTKINMRNMRAKFAALSIVDDQGKRLFTVADITLLRKKSSSALDRVFAASQKLSKMRDEDVKELTENFSAAPSGGSTSG